MNDEIRNGEKLFDQRERQPSWYLYALIFFLIALIYILHFIALLPIDGESMENTLHDKQKCLVLRNCEFDVDRNDIVTLNTAARDEPEHIIIKRVIALSGDKIVFMTDQSGHYVDLYVCENGSNRFTLRNEPFIKEKMLKSAKVYRTVKILDHMPSLTELDATNESALYPLADYITEVPKNSIFFLGDNRNISRDSRYYGTRTLDKVTSKVIYTFN